MGLFERVRTRVVKATGYSLAGLQAAWRNEEAFRFEVVIALLLFPVAVWLSESYVTFALLGGSLMLVMVVELLNSAIEAVVDQVTSEYAELAGRAKDLGSAAVLVSILLTLLVWIAVVFDRWWP